MRHDGLYGWMDSCTTGLASSSGVVLECILYEE